MVDEALVVVGGYSLDFLGHLLLGVETHDIWNQNHHRAADYGFFLPDLINYIALQ